MMPTKNGMSFFFPAQLVRSGCVLLKWSVNRSWILPQRSGAFSSADPQSSTLERCETCRCVDQSISEFLILKGECHACAMLHAQGYYLGTRNQRGRWESNQKVSAHIGIPRFIWCGHVVAKQTELQIGATSKTIVFRRNEGCRESFVAVSHFLRQKESNIKTAILNWNLQSWAGGHKPKAGHIWIDWRGRY